MLYSVLLYSVKFKKKIKNSIKQKKNGKNVKKIWTCVKIFL
jgi:hypothetical protein